MKKYKPKQNDLILVRWQDAQTHARWINQESVNKEQADEFGCAECETAGFFVGNTRGSFKIALTRSQDDDEYGDVFAIPSKQITEIHELVRKEIAEVKTDGQEKEKNQIKEKS